MNAEFQRIARRDKKAFLSDQCKEIDTTKKKASWVTKSKNQGDEIKKGKLGDDLKKIRVTKFGICHLGYNLGDDLQNFVT